jgi:hypothetical protein
MKIDIDFLANQLLPGKLTAVKSTNLIPNRASNHSQLDLDFLLASLLDYLKDISIEDITNFSNKIILGVDKTQNLCMLAEDSFVFFFRKRFRSE